MPGPNQPQNPQTATSRPGQSDQDRDRSREQDRNQERQGSAGRDAGRPQDDRDPNSPTRGTQRPDQPNALTDEDDLDMMETGASQPNEESRGGAGTARGAETGKTPDPGQPPRKV